MATITSKSQSDDGISKPAGETQENGLVDAAYDALQVSRDDKVPKDQRKDAVVHYLQVMEGIVQPKAQESSSGLPPTSKDLRRQLTHQTPKKIVNLSNSICIKYTGLTIDAEAKVKGDDNPTVLSSAVNVAKMAVSCFAPPPPTIRVLDNLSGILRPATLTLILGELGSGKSVFIKALAGRISKSSGLKVQGDITYNNAPLSEFDTGRVCNLMMQRDVHIGSLTVQETTEFAAQCQLGDNDRGQALEELPSGEKAAEAIDSKVVRRLRPQLVLSLISLDGVTNVIVGDNATRGISGGQKRRVSLAEALAGSSDVLFLDEMSTGLDSETTFSIVDTLSGAAHALGKTVVVNLLQPQAETFNLFDDVILFGVGSNGSQVVYHGPVDKAMYWARDLGFVCPDRKDPASFLLEITTGAGQRAYASAELKARCVISDVEMDTKENEGEENYDLLVSIDEMSKTAHVRSGFEESDNLEKGLGPDGGAPSRSWIPRKKYARDWLSLTCAIFKRQVRLDANQKGFMLATLIRVTITGIIYGTLFAFTPTLNDGRVALGVSTSAVVGLSFSAIPQIGIVFRTKPVVIKQRDAKYYPPSALITGAAVPQIFIALVECVVYAPIVYFLAGFYRNASYFFTFLLVIWSIRVAMGSLFRYLAYTIVEPSVCSAFTSFLVILCVLTNGFSIVQFQIPDYMVWLYWINPIAWSIRSLAINELTSPAWSSPSPSPSVPEGIYVLEKYGFYTTSVWIWAGVAYVWGFNTIVLVLSSFALKTARTPSNSPLISKQDAQTLMRKRVFDSSMRKKNFQLRRRHNAAQGSFKPITLVVRDLWYYVDRSRKKTKKENNNSKDRTDNMLPLLRGISFHAEPGTVTAIMGGSGAGKTTCLDVVIGHKTTGAIKGEILVNGYPKEQNAWARVAGYVEQMDLQTSQLTIEESVVFSGRLRLSEKDYSDSDVKRAAAAVIETVGLTTHSKKMVGNLGGQGLTVEQRKRLSIAVELVANPSILFLDEPTSGLDAAASTMVLEAIHKVAATGRTILCTIHQPTADAFSAFDQLLLLQPGGRVTYFGSIGDEACDVISYLESQPGVVPITPGFNVASWMLQVTGSAASTVFSSAGDSNNFPDIYSRSELLELNAVRSNVLIEECKANNEGPLAVDSNFATSAHTQRLWLFKKYWLIYYRAPEYNFNRLFNMIVIGVIYGLVYLGIANIDGQAMTSVATIQGVAGLCFGTTTFVGAYNSRTVQPLIHAERAVFYRERMRNMYKPGALSLASALVEVPWLMAQSFMLVVFVYWMAGFEATAWKFFYYLLTYFLIFAQFSYYGQFLVFATPTPVLGELINGIFNTLFMIFSGFLAPYPSCPRGWKWLMLINPVYWTLYGLVGSQLGDSQVLITSISGDVTTVSVYIQNLFGYEYSFIWWCPLILLAYCITWRVGTAVLISHVSFLKR